MESAFEIHQKLNSLYEGTEPFCLVSIVAAKGSTPRGVGAKMIVFSDGRIHGTIGGGKLEELARIEAGRVLQELRPQKVAYPLSIKADQCCGGEVELFFEPCNWEPRLYLFGAGHVGTAIARVFQGTDFRVRVIDSRSEWLTGLPTGVTTNCEEGFDFIDRHTWSKQNDFVLILTPAHELDERLVETLLAKPLRYLGLIGSQTKWRRFQTRLLSREVSPQDLARVKCPIGLNIGGKSPQEVAISVAAEILALYHEKARPLIRDEIPGLATSPFETHLSPGL